MAKLVAPEFTGLYAVPEDGEYRVVGFSPGGAGARVSRALSTEQYQRFAADRVLLGGLLAIEEAYDVVMGNYLDLEETVLRISANEMAQRRPHGRSDHFDTARRSCHRALANLLSAARAFQDQSLRLVSSIGGAGSDDLSSLRRSLSRAYDGSVGYRFMEAVRNHAQHHGVSVSGVSLTRTVADPFGHAPEQFVTTTPFLRLEDLRANDKFKPSVLAEITPIAEPGARPDDLFVPVIPLVRQYLAGLSSVMVDLRRLFSRREQTALDLIYAAYYHYTGLFTRDYPVELVVALATELGVVTHFGADAHFKARSLREVNGELSLLPLTGVRQ
jgi:hypothetical protein